MHWHRDGSRQRSRILYVFRTPGGVRVGRESLDPNVLRQIEAQHPDIAFDWKSVLANQQVVESVPESRRPRKRKRTEEDTEPSAAPVPKPEAPAAAPQPSIPISLQGATPDEQIAFLIRWHPIIRERVAQRTSDPARREALMALVDRLDPAAWTDADQIAEGLSRAADSLERLSRVLSRRRRKRRTPKSSSDTASTDTPPAVDS